MQGAGHLEQPTPSTPLQVQHHDIPMASLQDLQATGFAYLVYVWHKAHCDAQDPKDQKGLRDCFVKCFRDILALDANLWFYFNHLDHLYFTDLRSKLHQAWYKVLGEKSQSRQLRRGARARRARVARARSRDAAGSTTYDPAMQPAYVPAMQPSTTYDDDLRSRVEGIVRSLEAITRHLQRLTWSLDTYRV